MSDEELMQLMLKIDPMTKRIPSGVRKIVDAVISIEREACAKIVEAAPAIDLVFRDVAGKIRARGKQ